MAGLCGPVPIRMPVAAGLTRYRDISRAPPKPRTPSLVHPGTELYLTLARRLQAPQERRDVLRHVAIAEPDTAECIPFTTTTPSTPTRLLAVPLLSITSS